MGPNGQTPDLGYGKHPPGNIASAHLFGGNEQSLIENAIGTSSSDFIYGNSVGNVLRGGAGEDTIWGLDGDDHLIGNADWDKLYGGYGDDILDGGASFDELWGEEGNDRLIGGEGHDQLYGGSGDDTLEGGFGRDLLIGGEGTDILRGGEDDDQLEGGEGNDQLFGGSGADWLMGGGGADRMAGGLGDDRYIIDDAGDQIVKLMDEGFDTVHSSLDFIAFASIEQIILDGDAVSAIGNASANTIRGSLSANILNGLGGADLMYGGDGDDIYFVDDPGDNIREYTGGGNDTVYSSISYILPPTVPWPDDNHGAIPGRIRVPQPIENLILTGGANLNATANEGANLLEGNSGNNVLFGLVGDDRLYGHQGNDELVGGAGVDTLTGGLGSDVFRGTISDLNGDIITDLEAGDRIHITDAPADFSISRSGASLLLGAGASISLLGAENLSIRVRAPTTGGIDLVVVSGMASGFASDGHDFNGDGRSDILWRHGSGSVTNWLGTGTGGFTGNGANFFVDLPIDWSVAGSGDFNGDGKDDLLWRHSAGSITNWLGNGAGGFTGNGAAFSMDVPNEWYVAGIGDFNGDGKDDILWRNLTGSVTNWLGTDTGAFAGNGATFFMDVPNEWHVAGTGDFNGDGNTDILWRHLTGSVTNWLGTDAAGFTGNGATFYMDVANEWQIAGTGDFNGDGRDDILWRNSTGTVTDWLGTAAGSFMGNGAAFFMDVPDDWRIAGTGDYNGDGNDDILWRHSTGAVTDWLGTSTGSFTGNGANAYLDVPLDWIVQPGPEAAGEWGL